MKTSINLYVADNHFPLTVTEREEEILRKAAKLINEELSKRQGDLVCKRYSKEKLISAAAINVIANLLEETQIVSNNSVEKELEEVRMLLEDSII